MNIVAILIQVSPYLLLKEKTVKPNSLVTWAQIWAKFLGSKPAPPLTIPLNLSFLICKTEKITVPTTLSYYERWMRKYI